FGVLKELPGRRLRRDRSFQLRVFSHCSIQRDVQLVRNHLRDAICIAIAPSEHAADVAHYTFRLEFAESNDLCDAALAVFLPDVFEDFAAASFTEIHVDIRRRNAIRIQKPLENQAMLERVDVCDAKDERNDRACSRAAAWTDRYSFFLREMNKIPDNQE